MPATKKKVVRKSTHVPQIRPRRPVAATAQLLTIPQAADYTGFAAMTIRHWTQQKRLEYVKIAGGVRIRKKTLDELIDRGTVRPDKRVAVA